MIYIKLEKNMDKFMSNFNIPKGLKKIVFKSKIRNGKFAVQKINNLECIIIPDVNNKILNKLKILAGIRCWKNVCLSDNLRGDSDFLKFAKENSLNILNGRWLFKNISDQALEYVVNSNNEKLETKEISILCNNLDETIVEKIKEISQKVKICNVLTNNIKQYKKMEESIYKTNGILLNISNNYKKSLLKSSVVINFDFSESELKKCVFAKTSNIININENIDIAPKYWNGKNINFYEINMPEKYLEYSEILDGFNKSILYESFIYKKTNYKNIKKELEQDEAKILCLIDSNNEKIKNSNLNLQKTLDKITI